jgi:CRISPR-associated protein (TIGR02584 family)
MGMPDYTHTMLATLGGQPQVVTFTLDLLLNHFPIREVFVVHPKATDPRIQHSLDCLRAEFIDNRYRIDGRTIECRYSSRVLRLDGTPLEDIVDETSANGAHQTIYGLIRELKQHQHRIIHLSATGGRRVMSLLAVAAAQLTFNHMDHIWHIHTSREFRQQANEGAIMHASPKDVVRLIEVPFVPWGYYFPHLPQSTDTSSQLDREEQKRCTRVISALTESQRKTLRAFARGLSRTQVANELSLSIKTIDTHKTAIYIACRQEWPQPIDTHFLKDHFARYFDKDEYTSSKPL